MIIIAKKGYMTIKGKKYQIDPKKKKKISESIQRLKLAEKLMDVPSLKKKILAGEKVAKNFVIKELEKEIDKRSKQLKSIEEKEKKLKNMLRAYKR